MHLYYPGLSTEQNQQERYRFSIYTYTHTSLSLSVYKYIYYKELTHVIVVLDKSQKSKDLQGELSNWDPGELMGLKFYFKTSL